MTVKLTNMTNYANIYEVFDGSKQVGTVELIVAGAYCGTYCRTWSGKYTNRDIKKAWTAYRKEKNK